MNALTIELGGSAPRHGRGGVAAFLHATCSQRSERELPGTHAEVGGYVAMLMDLLKLDANTEVH